MRGLKKAKEILSELEALYEKQRKQLKKPKEWKHWEHPGEPKGNHIDEIVKLEKTFSRLYLISRRLIQPWEAVTSSYMPWIL